MLGIPQESQDLLHSIQLVVGPLQELNHFSDPGDWVLQGTYQGRPLRFLVHTYKSRLSGISFGVPLDGRPIALTIHDRKTTILGVPVVAFGDPAFEGQFVVNGWPSAVLQTLIDPSVRQWLLAHRAGTDPNIRTEDGFLMMHETLVSYDGLQRRVRVPPPEEVAEWVRSAVSLADRANAAFDHVLAGVAGREGHAGAERWIRQHAELMEARAKRRSTVRYVVFAGMAALVVVPIVVLLLVMLWMGASAGFR